MFRAVAVTLEMIKFQHTVFALPFAFLGAFTAAGGVPEARTILWILVAMVGARSAAMAFNRLADERIDAANPRTQSRALPAGLVSRSFVAAFTIASIALFLLAASMLNRLAFLLAPLALVIILGYSLTKRFTSLSHLILGLALAIAPAGAAIAVSGHFDPRILPLALAVLFWTAGFDVLYSLQDVAFDHAMRLHSIPAAIGPHRALLVARLFHLMTIASLALFGIAAGFGWLYFAGVAAAAALLVWQHSIVSADDLSRIDAAFFTANGILSIVLFVFGACDILIRSSGSP
ncbi:MAG TPA: UbiA-like polyprenyltransferase [Thermoanaerobaculia bacterium]|nr:UbiA-like polyprenyltransferase [Thermoanaerobaculia bacterium]